MQERKEEVVYTPDGRYMRTTVLLGEGSYKRVYKAIDLVEGREVAWNIIINTRRSFGNEVNVLHSINSKYVIQFYDSYFDRGMVFITELMQSGTLREYYSKIYKEEYKIRHVVEMDNNIKEKNMKRNMKDVDSNIINVVVNNNNAITDGLNSGNNNSNNNTDNNNSSNNNNNSDNNTINSNNDSIVENSTLISDLVGVSSRNRCPFTLRLVKKWSIMILRGISELHGQGLMHRDIKTENIFVDGPTGILKLGDLGVAKFLGIHRSILGTPEYMAREILEGGGYDERVDIYAYGMVLLELVTGMIPFSEINNKNSKNVLFNGIQNGAIPASLELVEHGCLKNLILQCIQRQDGRMYVDELKKHHFFSGNRLECVKEICTDGLIEITVNKEVLIIIYYMGISNEFEYHPEHSINKLLNAVFKKTGSFFYGYDLFYEGGIKDEGVTRTIFNGRYIQPINNNKEEEYNNYLDNITIKNKRNYLNKEDDRKMDEYMNNNVILPHTSCCIENDRLLIRRTILKKLKEATIIDDNNKYNIHFRDTIDLDYVNRDIVHHARKRVYPKFNTMNIDTSIDVNINRSSVDNNSDIVVNNTSIDNPISVDNINKIVDGDIITTDNKEPIEIEIPDKIEIQENSNCSNNTNINNNNLNYTNIDNINDIINNINKASIDINTNIKEEETKETIKPKKVLTEEQLRMRMEVEMKEKELKIEKNVLIISELVLKRPWDKKEGDVKCKNIYGYDLEENIKEDETDKDLLKEDITNKEELFNEKKKTFNFNKGVIHQKKNNEDFWDEFNMKENEVADKSRGMNRIKIRSRNKELKRKRSRLNRLNIKDTKLMEENKLVHDDEKLIFEKDIKLENSDLSEENNIRIDERNVFFINKDIKVEGNKLISETKEEYKNEIKEVVSCGIEGGNKDIKIEEIKSSGNNKEIIMIESEVKDKNVEFNKNTINSIDNNTNKVKEELMVDFNVLETINAEKISEDDTNVNESREEIIDKESNIGSIIKNKNKSQFSEEYNKNNIPEENNIKKKENVIKRDKNKIYLQILNKEKQEDIEVVHNQDKTLGLDNNRITETSNISEENINKYENQQDYNEELNDIKEDKIFDDVEMEIKEDKFKRVISDDNELNNSKEDNNDREKNKVIISDDKQNIDISDNQNNQEICFDSSDSNESLGVNSSTEQHNVDSTLKQDGDTIDDTSYTVKDSNISYDSNVVSTMNCVNVCNPIIPNKIRRNKNKLSKEEESFILNTLEKNMITHRGIDIFNIYIDYSGLIPDTMLSVNIIKDIAMQSSRMENLPTWSASMVALDILTVGELRLLTKEDWNTLNLSVFCVRMLINAVYGRYSPKNEDELPTNETIKAYSDNTTVSELCNELLIYRVSILERISNSVSDSKIVTIVKNQISKFIETLMKEDIKTVGDLKMLRSEDWDRIDATVCQKRIIKNAIRRVGRNIHSLK